MGCSLPTSTGERRISSINSMVHEKLFRIVGGPLAEKVLLTEKLVELPQVTGEP